MLTLTCPLAKPHSSRVQSWLILRADTAPYSAPVAVVPRQRRRAWFWSEIIIYKLGKGKSKQRIYVNSNFVIILANAATSKTQTNKKRANSHGKLLKPYSTTKKRRFSWFNMPLCHFTLDMQAACIFWCPC